MKRTADDATTRKQVKLAEDVEEEEDLFEQAEDDRVLDHGELYSTKQLDELEKDEIEPFNLDEEKEMGTFDKSGAFTWTRRDLDEEGDSEWLEQVGDQVARPKRQVRHEARVMEPISVTTWKVVCELKQQENGLMALKRLPTGSSAFATLTEKLQILVENGLVEAYTKTRDELIARLPAVLWQYKVDESQVYGPFSGVEMQDWRDSAGYFTAEAEEQPLVRCMDWKEHHWRCCTEIKTFLLDPWKISQQQQQQHERKQTQVEEEEE